MPRRSSEPRRVLMCVNPSPELRTEGMTATVDLLSALCVLMLETVPLNQLNRTNRIIGTCTLIWSRSV